MLELSGAAVVNPEVGDELVEYADSSVPVLGLAVEDEATEELQK